MMTSEIAQRLLRELPRLTLKRASAEEEAGAIIVSLPWPMAEEEALSPGGRTTLRQSLGRWPESRSPRRMLLLSEADGAPAPETLSLMPSGAPTGEPLPAPDLHLISCGTSRAGYWENHALQLHHATGSARIALGLRSRGRVAWWEACRLVITRQGPEGMIVEMGGVIRHDFERPGREMAHRHNWLNGNLHLRILPNGVCEVHAHFVNGRFFDEGLDLADAVPVIGFDIDDADPSSLMDPWTGETPRFSLGQVSFDMADAARLATPRQPGSWSCEGSFAVWQPFAGVEVFGGAHSEATTGDPYIVHAQAHEFPRGMARTLRFSLNLSGGPASIIRYLPPAWWYGMCGELGPRPHLPISAEPWEAHLQEAREWIKSATVKGGFEDGAIPRYLHVYWPEHDRHEAGWDGEVPFAQFLNAWRTGDAEDYALAMRSAWHFTDVAVNHASHLVRMHGWMDGYSLPMNRAQGTIAAYLETGIPYLLDTARAIVANAHTQHRSAWPRLAVGRDGCYLRGAVLLYRYFGDTYFREIAHEGALTMARSQRSDGSFGDQGGGAGLHQVAGYLAKPWMGLLGLSGVMDYLDAVPTPEPELEEAVRRFAEWLLSEQWEREGRFTWSYEHHFLGERIYFKGSAGDHSLPTVPRWHHETLARLLGWSALRFSRPEFLSAWLDSYQPTLLTENSHEISSNTIAPVLEYLPWLLDQLWQAEPVERGLRVFQPFDDPRLPESLTLQSPDGRIALRRESLLPGSAVELPLAEFIFS